MVSSAQKGAYYKNKTKAWLEKVGYAVAHMERVHWIQTPKGRIPIKRDQFGADLLAMRRQKLIFVQVKLGSPSLPKTIRTFREFPFTDAPGVIRIWSVTWKKGAHEPKVVDVTDQVLAPL